MLDKGTKLIWQGLADYANAKDLATGSDSLQNLAVTLSDCMPWMARTPAIFEKDVPEMVALHTNPAVLRGTTNGKPVWYGFLSEQALANKFRDQALEYQPQVRRLLKWLSDPRRHGEDKSAAWGFLLTHTSHVEFKGSESAEAPPEEEYRNWKFSGQAKTDFPYRTLAYKDIADPICDFIQRQYELWREAPIRICKRPGCGNLVAQFKKREYCRTAGCDRERQKRESDIDMRRNRDRVFVFRLKRLSLAMRRKKTLENVERLREMARFWQEPEHNNPSIAKHALKTLESIGS